MRLLEFFRPYRVIVTRRVTEEEQVSVECIRARRAQAQDDLAAFLLTFRDHRKRTNEEVVKATREQLTALDTSITAKGEETRRLDEEIETKRIEVKNLDGMIKQRRGKLGIVPPPGQSQADLQASGAGGTPIQNGNGVSTSDDLVG